MANFLTQTAAEPLQCTTHCEKLCGYKDDQKLLFALRTLWYNEKDRHTQTCMHTFPMKQYDECDERCLCGV